MSSPALHRAHWSRCAEVAALHDGFLITQGVLIERLSHRLALPTLGNALRQQAKTPLEGWVPILWDAASSTVL
jgi:hypothetical protein